MSADKLGRVFAEVSTQPADDLGEPDTRGVVQAFGFDLSPDETEALAEWLHVQANVARRAGEARSQYPPLTASQLDPIEAWVDPPDLGEPYRYGKLYAHGNDFVTNPGQAWGREF